MARCFLATVCLLSLLEMVSSFTMHRKDNVAVYWGQKSSISLADACDNDNYNMIIMGFVTNYNTSVPNSLVLNLAGNCGEGMSPCSDLAKDITTCQSKGKAVTLSLGGGSLPPWEMITLNSDQEAKDFGNMMYNTFLGGSVDDPKRPFGSAVLDGFDLDIEQGSTDHFDVFIQTVRDASTQNHDSRWYYFTAAPQCPQLTGQPYGNLFSTTPFDALFVQFYNNDCGLDAWPESPWNFDAWNNWAENDAPNNGSVKVYIGAPAASGPGMAHYVDAQKLGDIILDTVRKYGSFGGVMLWDIYAAKSNDNFDAAVKKDLNESMIPKIGHLRRSVNVGDLLP
ncbi:hypothetical protein GSI_02028 [Ganoderma sinense ZZ0214-1]|uniref:chitinase n=1 Tax=Ganoderma sinense ZZ0214-1 TaxID=1077348 RepID=A0A2G8SNK5_9APHY|nr:hypothetical protein GSI_02028 [Ganoderma sinense ZZ0214-1]